MPNTSAMCAPLFAKLAPTNEPNLRINIANSVPPSAVNALKNAAKWLNKPKPFDRATTAAKGLIFQPII